MPPRNQILNPRQGAGRRWRVLGASSLAGLLLALQTGCMAPMGADRSSPRIVYGQTHENAISSGHPSAGTKVVLHRFDQTEQFEESPDAVLQLIHQKAVESGEHDLLYALSELNYLEGERVRRSVKPWEPRDARDYYLASAVYAWFFLFDGPAGSLPGPFDTRFRTACDLYNYGLGWALTERRGTNAMALLQGGTRQLPVGQIEMRFSQPGFSVPLTRFSGFALADQYLVRGLSVRNRQPGLGVPLVAIAKPIDKVKLSRAMPVTVLLRLEGGLADLSSNQCRASLELYSAFGKDVVQVGDRSVPLETDTTIPIAYTLNQSFVWSLGSLQFLSGEEQIPSDIYLTRPYQPGRVPVVFVHGTFSSPIWWAEMMNTLDADPELRERCQFWFFIYNSGNPIVYSAAKLRESLTAKLKELDPEGRDPALQQMVVIGHSQGGLLTKLTATDTGDQLWRLLNTNRLEDLQIPAEQQALARKFLFYQPLPCVKRVIFISTPHRGSYQIGNFLRNLAHDLVSLPRTILDQSKELMGLKEKIRLPPEMKGMSTSLDGMSPRNPLLLKLADIPTAPGVTAHSIIAVQGEGDYHEGKDGVVSYPSAHVDYAESEFIVRSFHSCQDKAPTIEEVRRILHEHLASLPPSVTNAAALTLTPAKP